MISSLLLILPVTALLIFTVACLVPVNVFWAVVEFVVKLRIEIKTSAESIPEASLPCKSFSYLPLVIPAHRESH